MPTRTLTYVFPETKLGWLLGLLSASFEDEDRQGFEPDPFAESPEEDRDTEGEDDPDVEPTWENSEL